jgi:hypothetical protein
MLVQSNTNKILRFSIKSRCHLHLTIKLTIKIKFRLIKLKQIIKNLYLIMMRKRINNLKLEILLNQ